VTDQPTVALLRQYWLPKSETFIRDQVQLLSSWSPVTGGYLRLPEPLIEPDAYAISSKRFGWRILETAPRSLLANRLAKKLARRAPSLMHVHFGNDALDLLPVHERLDVPLFVTFHGFDATATRDPLLANYFDRIGDVFERATKLLAVSDFIAGRLVELGAPPAKVVTRYNGIPLGPRTAAPRDGVTDESASVLFVGRLVEKKGVADLLAAVAALPPDLRSTAVDVVGDGPLRSQLEVQARELGVNARFHDFVTHERIRVMMARASVVAVPSREASDGDCEGLPTVAVEASSVATPVVATRHAGLPEIVLDEETGLLSDEGDIQALSTNLARILSDAGLRTRLGRAGADRVRAAFDMHDQVAALERLYDAAGS
jgi:glycosyltransferase involved in cell wall biosynthesis